MLMLSRINADHRGGAPRALTSFVRLAAHDGPRRSSWGHRTRRRGLAASGGQA
jgi:hypothetical protein